jgi:hypothetical protein
VPWGFIGLTKGRPESEDGWNMDDSELSCLESCLGAVVVYAVPVEVGGEVCSRLNPWAKFEQVVLLLHRRARARG